MSAVFFVSRAHRVLLFQFYKKKKRFVMIIIWQFTRKLFVGVIYKVIRELDAIFTWNAFSENRVVLPGVFVFFVAQEFVIWRKRS